MLYDEKMGGCPLIFPSFASAVAMEVSYGLEISSWDDEYLVNTGRYNEMVAFFGVQGSNLLDVLPIREYFQSDICS